MPRFYHQDDPDLSDLNRAKKKVNSDYAKQYQSQDGNHDNLGQTQDVDSIYNTLSTRLLALQTALQDLFNILEVGSGSANFFSPQQRASLQQFASKILTEVNAVQLIMSRIKGFNMFTPPQAQGLADLVSQINALNDFIDGIVSQLGGVLVGPQITDIIQTYEPQIKLLLQFLIGASSNYQSIEANPKTVEAQGAGLFGDAQEGAKKLFSQKGAKQTFGALGNATKNFFTGGVAYHYRPPTMTGGAIVPAFNGEGVYGSDGYRIGDYYTYTDPRRFY